MTILQKLKELTDALWPTVKTSQEIASTVQPSILKAGGVYSNVPPKWKWLLGVEQLPAIVAEGLKEYGTLEGRGSLNNKRIINWADEVVKSFKTNYTNWAADWYNQDSVPWCGLFMAVIACRSAAGKKYRLPVDKYLTALAWVNWGQAVSYKSNLNNIWCGDVGVFTRSGGGHVGIVIGVSKDGKYIVILGGNQDNMVNIKLMPISRLYAIRRPRYTIRPKGAKHFRIATTGVPISTNEQ